MKPLCSPPNKSPAPRISRSFMAILKPEPRSVNCSSAWSRLRASSVSVLRGGAISLQKAFLLERPTRPRIWCRSDIPKWLALLIIMVFAFDTSSPLSMMVVATRTSYLPSIKSSMTFSNFFPSIWPCPTAILASGTKRWIIPATSWMLLTLLLIKKTCPPRWIS